MERIEGLKKDIAELETFLNIAARQKSKDILSIEIRKLISEVLNIEEKLKPQKNDPSQNIAAATTPTSGFPPSKRYEVKITNYAWDQSDNFVKFYITLKDVKTIASANVTCEFTSKGVNLMVRELDNKDYTWKIKNLLKEIDPQKSSWKIKTDMILISAAKKSSGNWSHVTEWEKKASESKTPKLDSEKMDPSESLMSLMKNMYDTGDDEMKRTIAKAWTESQQKKGNEDMMF